MVQKIKLIVGVTGASGAIYAKKLLETFEILRDQWEEIALLFSDNAKLVWKYELPGCDLENLPFRIYGMNDFFAPIASGSAGYHAMIVIPCSMGTLGRIASGVSSDLLARSADVMLKERRKLILVTRETPLNHIHIRNMLTVTESGGIICPASPSFYNLPETIDQLVQSVTDRALTLAGFSVDGFSWGAHPE